MNFRPFLLSVLVFVALIESGCVPPGLLDEQQAAFEEDKEKDEQKSTDEQSDYPDAPEGSCNAWKYAYCDAVASCSAFVTRDQCELDLGWLVCDEDAQLGKCETKIRAALKQDSCDTLPSGCDPSTIADRRLPTELCETIHMEMCEFRFFCGLEFSTDACLDTLALTEPCDEFTSFLPTAVDCAEAYSKLGCEEGMPPVCAGALRY